MDMQQTLFKQLTQGLSFDKTRYRKELTKLGDVLPDMKPVTESDQDDAYSNSSHSDSESLEKDAEVPAAKQTLSKKEKKQQLNEAQQKHISQMKQLRSKHSINASGTDMPDPITDFSQLVTEYKVHERLVSKLLQQGYTEPTPIQMQIWPLMLRGREILASAPTGSGKTAAFLLPMIHQLKSPRALGFRALVVSPTRELAEQTYRECSVLCEDTGLKVHLIDKVDKVISKFGPGSSQKFDILITTPNRLVFILMAEETMINLSNIEWLIVDECDRLFEGGKRGFKGQLSTIYMACSGLKVKRALFSATQSQNLHNWCRDNLSDLAHVNVGPRNTASQDVEQELVFCGDESGKIHALRNIFRKGYEPPCLVFVQTKERARQLFYELMHDGVMVDAIHADRTQKQRETCVQAFRAKKIWVLICTELMSRGIDFKGVNLVINYDFPPSKVSYIHRIGRTGRAQQKGKAVTFWTLQDQRLLQSISQTISKSGSSVPEWMKQLRRLAPEEKRVKQQKRDRGFVSEGAKFTKHEQEKRKKHQLSKKLTQLRLTGEGSSEKSEMLKAKLYKVIDNQKKTQENELKQLDRKDERKKRKREKKDAKNPKKNFKKKKTE